jgi:branched-chain amino acid transport system substrate-binding protein
MRKKAWIGTIAALGVTLMLILWFGNLSPYRTDKVSIVPIRIGAVVPLTGSLAPYGEWTQNGLELARDGLNRTRGTSGQRIELLIEDSISSPKDAVSAFRKLITVDRVPVVIGFIGSSEALACAPIANETKTVLFSSGAASPDLTAAGDYVFRNRVSGTLEVNDLARYARQKLGIKTVAIVFINTDYGKSYQQLFAQEFLRLGGKVLHMDGFDQGETDFRSQIAKLKRIAGLQAVYLPVHTKEGASFLKQSREMGLKLQFLASNAIVSPDLFTIAGDAAQGLIYSEPAYDPQAMDEPTRLFEELYARRFGVHSEMFAANAYDALRIVVLAIDRGGYNSEGIKSQLYKVKDFQGVSGNTTLDKNGDVRKPIAIRQVRGRDFITLIN